MPIIAMTAHAMDNTRTRCLAAGMSDHISKPVRLERLYGLLKKWISTLHPPSSKSSWNTQPILEIPGVDAVSALEAMAGNRPLFFKILRQFRETHGNTVEEIRKALNFGDQAVAVRMVHSIKGAAGLFGAYELKQHAEYLETVLREGNVDVQDQAITTFDAVLKPLIIALEDLEAEPNVLPKSEPEEPPDSSQRALLLERLSDLLWEHDPESDHVLDLLRPLLRVAPTALLFRELETHVADYDYQDALVVINRICQILNMPLPRQRAG